MTWTSILFTDVISIIAIVGVFRLLRRRLLTVSIGLAWILVVGGLAAVMTVPPLRNLWIHVSKTFFDSPPYIVALVLFLLVFLIYQSVVVSVLQRQVREMGQHIALNLPRVQRNTGN
ncbi:MAG: DUF2304 family protein [Chloroflexi bacterium]|nr:DUF2304 family protein [Chloroflexota bacterium]